MRIFRGVIREYFKWLGQRAGLAVAAAVSCFVLLAPISLFGRELDFRGQKVTVEGLAEGDWEYVNGTDDSAIILVSLAADFG